MLRKFLTVPLIVVFALVATTAAAESAIAHLTSYDGSIEVLRGGIPLTLFPDMPLAAGDTILTRDGRGTLRLNDRTEIVLLPASRLTLPMSGAAIDIGAGNVKLTVPGNSKVDVAAASALFAVEPGAVEVAVAKTGSVVIGVVSGGATLTTTQGDGKSGTLRLLAGQMTSVSPNQPPTLPRSFETGSVVGGRASAELAKPTSAPKSPPPPAPLPVVPTPVPVVAASLPPPPPMGTDDSRQTQGKYAVQLIHALGIASALPANATTQDAIEFLTRLGIEPCREDRTPISPLLPFPHTGDLHVLDAGSGQVLRFDGKGKVAIAVKREAILELTGRGDVQLGGHGIAFDATGALYFTEGAAGAVLKRATEGSSLFALATNTQLGVGVRPTGIAFGGDGLLYVADDASGAILKLDPITGTVTATIAARDLNDAAGVTRAQAGTGLVGSPGGLHLLSIGDPPAVLQLGAGGVSALVAGARLGGSGAFLTRGKNGELLFTDDALSQVLRVGSDGVLVLALDKARIEDTAGAAVGLHGGIAVDEHASLFLVDTRNQSILRFSGSDSGEIWVTAKAIEDKTKVAPQLGAAAFPNRGSRGGGWVADKEIELSDLLCLAGIDPNDPNAPLTISLEEMIDRILERYGDLFWLQVRRKQSVSPFAP